MATALGCTLPAATGTVGATPLRPTKTLDCAWEQAVASLGPWESVAKEATQTASRVVVVLEFAHVLPYRAPPLAH